MGDNGGRLQGRQRDAPALSHLQSYPMLVGLQITLGLSRHSSPGRALLPEQGPRGRVESQTLCVERGQAGVVLQWQLTMRSRFCVCGIAIGGCGRAAGGLRPSSGRKWHCRSAVVAFMHFAVVARLSNMYSYIHVAFYV